MKSILTNVLIALVIGVIAVVCAYFQRGYWAVGFELFVPVIAAALLLFMEGEENE